MLFQQYGLAFKPNGVFQRFQRGYNVRPSGISAGSSVRNELEDIERIVHGQCLFVLVLTKLGLGVNISQEVCQLLQVLVGAVR